MAGVHYYSIEQIPTIEQDVKMITIGTVISISKEENFLSFIISDSTDTSEATYYEKKSQYLNIGLPKVGDTIELLGTCWTKPLASEKKKLFLKIKINRWRVVSFDEEIQIMEKILNSRKKRFEKKLRDQIVEIRKKVPIKQKDFSDQEMVDIRSLIFSYMYIVFSSNKDINSLIFCAHMIKSHHLCKEYSKEKSISQKSMQSAIKRGLSYLTSNGIIELRQLQASEISLGNPDQYIIKKRFFERLVVEIQEYVFQKKATGATLEQVTKAMNEKFSKYNEEDFLYNWKFIQKVLIDLIDSFRLYKTSDKRLFPYN